VPRRLRPALAAVLAAAALGGGAQPAMAAPGESRVVRATPRDGVRLVGDLRVGPLGSARAAATLADVRAVWGPERALQRRRCLAGWGTGVRLLFTSFGGPSACEERFLQAVHVTGARWTVSVGGATYAVGAPRTSLPADARRVPGYGYELATMPFIGSRTTSVAAHVSDGRIDRFWVFIGAAGD
jgi:hypothetical protein